MPQVNDASSLLFLTASEKYNRSSKSSMLLTCLAQLSSWSYEDTTATLVQRAIRVGHPKKLRHDETHHVSSCEPLQTRNGMLNPKSTATAESLAWDKLGDFELQSHV